MPNRGGVKLSQKKRKLTKKQKETRKKIVLFVVAFSLIFFLGYGLGKNGLNKEKWDQAIEKIENQIKQFGNEQKQKQSKITGTAEIRILDVGQGSATLLQSEDGTNILIDTGRDDDKEKRIIQYLDKYIGTGGKIDLLIFTHNHADHLGYGDQILSYYRVNEVWMNGLDTTTKVYERVLDALADSDAVYKEPIAGEKADVGAFHLEVLKPEEVRKNDQNDSSIVLRVGLNQFSLMITGDASSVIEKEIVENESIVRSNVLLLGHHGSAYSSDETWLEAVNPDVGIYSAGTNNTYGHPSPDTLKRVEKLHIPIYGTDKDGSITIRVEEDGTYQIKTEKGETQK